MQAQDASRYFARLFRYTWAERRLMVLSILFGVVGLCLPFVYPLLIGRVIDTVILAHPVPSAAADPRLHRLLLITAAAALTAIAWAIVGYCKGHFTLQLGNHVVTRIRRDLFVHLQKLSLQFYAKERTGAIVWRLVHEVNGVANVIYAGVLLLAFDVIQLTVAAAASGFHFPKIGPGGALSPSALRAGLLHLQSKGSIGK